jgi:hypothetical protein
MPATMQDNMSERKANGNDLQMFEKLYLNPKTDVKGDLRGTFANPTPL